MRISDPLQLCAGMKLFCVNGFSGSTTYECNISREEVVDIPLPPHRDATAPKVWILLRKLAFHDDITSLRLQSGGWHESNSCANWIHREDLSSMQDMGIIQQSYNNHQVFTDLTEAKLYGEGKLDLSDIDEAPVLGVYGDYDRAMTVI